MREHGAHGRLLKGTLMADLGSVQLLAFAFDVRDRLPSDVAREVRRLRARGVVGVLDVLIVSTDANGGLSYEAESSDLEVSSLPSDSSLSRLFEDDTSEPGSVESLELHSFGEIGLDLETIETFRAACSQEPHCCYCSSRQHGQARCATPRSRPKDSRSCSDVSSPKPCSSSVRRSLAPPPPHTNADVAAAAVSAEMLDALACAGDAASAGVGATLRTLLSAGFIVEADVVEAVRAIAEADLLPRSALSSATTLRVAGRAPTGESGTAK